MKKLGFIVSIMMILAACGHIHKQRKKIDVADKYSIEIPMYMDKALNLNEDASLQYQYLPKEFFVIVLDESAEEMHQIMNENELTDRYSTLIPLFFK